MQKKVNNTVIKLSQCKKSHKNLYVKQDELGNTWLLLGCGELSATTRLPEVTVTLSETSSSWKLFM